MISLEEDIRSSMERALIFGAFMDSLAAPSPSQIWLERAAAELRQQRDPDGSKNQNRAQIVARLTERDGHNCWFCGRGLGGDISIEHLTPLALQGSWADGNLALAHKGCNKAAGHLTRFEKERLREEMRAASVDTLPKGRDAKQGSVGTKGSAVLSDSEADAQPPSPSHPSLRNREER